MANVNLVVYVNRTCCQSLLCSPHLQLQPCQLQLRSRQRFAILLLRLLLKVLGAAVCCCCKYGTSMLWQCAAPQAAHGCQQQAQGAVLQRLLGAWLLIAAQLHTRC